MQTQLIQTPSTETATLPKVNLGNLIRRGLVTLPKPTPAKGNGKHKAAKPTVPKAAKLALSTPELLDFSALLRDHYDSSKRRLNFKAALDAVRSARGLGSKELLNSVDFSAVKDAEKLFREAKLIEWHSDARPGTLKQRAKAIIRASKNTGLVSDVFRRKASASDHDMSPEEQRAAAAAEAMKLRSQVVSAVAEYSGRKPSKEIPATEPERALLAADWLGKLAKSKARAEFAGEPFKSPGIPQWARKAFDNAKRSGEERAKAEKAQRMEAKDGTSKALGKQSK